MKLNPFKKSTGRHFDGLSDEYAKLSQKLASAQQELAQAENDLRSKDQEYQQCRAQSKNTSFSPAEKNLLAIRNQAEQRLADMKNTLADLQSQHTLLQRKVEAPVKTSEARETYQRLAARRKELQGELEKTRATIERLENRVTDLEQRAGEETKSAAQALVEAEGDLPMPEGFGNIDAELRVTRAALIEVKERAEVVTAELQPIQEQIEVARTTFIGYRAIAAEQELMDQLPSFVEIIARAAVTRHMSHPSHNPDRYTVEIPRAVVDAMYESLGAELAA